MILQALGLEHLVSFEKQCANYRFTAEGRDMLATVVTVPQIDGTFIELETIVPELEITAALSDIRAVLHELGITDEDLPTEQYTDAVMHRHHRPLRPKESRPLLGARHLSATPRRFW